MSYFYITSMSNQTAEHGSVKASPDLTSLSGCSNSPAVTMVAITSRRCHIKPSKWKGDGRKDRHHYFISGNIPITEGGQSYLILASVI